MLQNLQQMSAFAQKFSRALLQLSPGESAELRHPIPARNKKAPASAGA
jgi:hypothetical protein